MQAIFWWDACAERARFCFERCGCHSFCVSCARCLSFFFATCWTWQHPAVRFSLCMFTEWTWATSPLFGLKRCHASIHDTVMWCVTSVRIPVNFSNEFAFAFLSYFFVDVTYSRVAHGKQGQLFRTLSTWFNSCSTQCGWSRAFALQSSSLALLIVIPIVHRWSARCHRTAMLSWIHVPSTSGRSQEGESGTRPADESQRKTIGVVGAVALQLKMVFTSCWCHAPQGDRNGWIGTETVTVPVSAPKGNPRRRTAARTWHGKLDLAAVEMGRLRRQVLYHMALSHLAAPQMGQSGASFDPSHVTGQAHAGQWCLKLHRNKRVQTDPGLAARANREQGCVCLNNAPVWGVESV